MQWIPCGRATMTAMNQLNLPGVKNVFSSVFGEEALSESQCRRWFQRFKNGNESLEDEEHGSRPQVVDNQVLKSVIELDPCQTTRELATHFGCSNSTIHEPLLVIGKKNRLENKEESERRFRYKMHGLGEAGSYEAEAAQNEPSSKDENCVLCVCSRCDVPIRERFVHRILERNPENDICFPAHGLAICRGWARAK
ncbi:hypothetical protein COOONC_05677 [Cooperia oncophora]